MLDSLPIPPLAAGTIQLWIAPAALADPANSGDELRALLDEQEIRRAERFAFDSNRREFIVGRALVRLVLGRHFQVHPCEIKLAAGRFGKPKICELLEPGPHRACSVEPMILHCQQPASTIAPHRACSVEAMISHQAPIASATLPDEPPVKNHSLHRASSVGAANAGERSCSAESWVPPSKLGGDQAARTVEASLDFNVSHSAGLVVAAFSLEGEVGVDVEEAERPISSAVMRQVFTREELASWESLSPAVQRRAAAARWTLKEAYLKARGAGLNLPLQGFAFDESAGEPRIRFTSLLDDDPARWQFQKTNIAPRHVVSLAIRDARATAIRPCQLVWQDGKFGWLRIERPIASAIFQDVQSGPRRACSVKPMILHYELRRSPTLPTELARWKQ